MPKLVVKHDGKVLSESELGNQELVIGRGVDCDIHLNDPAVSRHHAKVAKIYTGFFIEDLHSTNGVTLNGRRVRKHMLKDGDLIQVGAHQLLYANDQREQPEQPPAEVDKTVVLAPTRSLREDSATPKPSQPAQQARIRYLNGPDQGGSAIIDKSLYTLGKPGENLAVISRRAGGHFLLHLGGDGITTLNGEAVHGAGVLLTDGDVIEVGDTRLEFYLDP